MGAARSRRLVGAALALGFLAVAAAAAEWSQGRKKGVVRAIGKRLERKAYAEGTDWRRWPEHVAAHRAALDAAATDDEVAAALEAALDEFAVSHLWVWTAEEMRARREGELVWAGIAALPLEGGLFATWVAPDGPAWEAGLRKGDWIASVDGVAPPAREDLGGRAGERKRLEWRRGEQAFAAEVELRPHRRAPPPRLTWLAGGLAHLEVSTFSHELYDRPEIERLFGELAPARGLILDLRSNGGGRSGNVEHLLAMVLPRDEVTHYVIHRGERDRCRRRRGLAGAALLEVARACGQTMRPLAVERPPYRGPLVVLVDSRSGSGGDVFPGAIQDAGRGPIVGSSTVGQVLAGRNHELPGGLTLFYPVAEMLRLDGSRYEGRPVAPDVELTPRETADDALILGVASRLLAEGAAAAAGG